MTNEYWYKVQTRGLETIAVWQTFSPGFTVGELTAVQHTAEVASLYTHIQEYVTAQAAADMARASRDANGAELRDLCVRALRIIHGSLPSGDSMRAEVRLVTRVRGYSQQAMVNKCHRLVSLWNTVNAHRAVELGSLPGLLVGTTNVTQFQTMLTAHAQTLQEVENKVSALSRKKSQLRATTAKVNDNNKRWYSAWRGQFAAGSPERDALSQISTGSSVTAPGQGVFLSLEALANQVVRLTFDAPRATQFKLWHKGPGDADFAVLAEGLTAKTFEHTAQAFGGHAYKVAGSNGAGVGAESLPTVITVAQQLAA